MDAKDNTFGPYRLDRLVAQTVTGTVFSATHNQLKRRFTLNVLHPLTDRDPACVLNFTREMAAATEINHPNVMRVTEAGVVKDLHYIAVEHVDGIDLQTIATRDGKVAPAIACEVIRQAAVGVHCIHQNNLLHRGINPANLVLSKKGIIKIDGLGVAALQGTEQSDESISELDNYLAPEQLAGRAERRSDIYGLGCTLYRLLTGELPPLGADRRTAAEEKSFLTMIAPELSPDLVAMVQHMMEVEPELRVQTPSQVVAAMCTWAGGEKLPKLVARHSKANMDAKISNDVDAHADTSKVVADFATTHHSSDDSNTNKEEPSKPNASKTSKRNERATSKPKSSSWIWPIGLACIFAACVFTYGKYAFDIHSLLGLQTQQEEPAVVVLKTDSTTLSSELDVSTRGQEASDQPDKPVVISDTYHTKLRQQLREEYGLTGGQWVLTPNEVALISNVVTYGTNVSQTTTADADFTHLIRMNVDAEGSNPWDAGLYVPNVQGIQKGDRVLMVVWLRTSPASMEEIGKLNVYVEDANSDEKEVYLTVNPTGEWRQFLIPFEANATAELRVGFHLAFQEQEIDYAGLTLINYGTSVPFWDAKSSTMRNQ